MRIFSFVIGQRRPISKNIVIYCALIFVALATSVGTSIAADQSRALSLYIDYSGNDIIGGQIFYFLRQYIDKSTELSNAASEKQSTILVYLVTTDENPQTPGRSAAISWTLVISGNKMYLGSGVMTCGAYKIQYCAQSLVSSIANVIF